MAMTREERNRLALVGAGAVVLGGLLGLALRGLFSKSAPSPASPHPTAAPVDTPIVLVGGSLTFTTAASGYQWWQDGSAGFHVSPSYAIKSIVVKTNQSGDGDGTAGSDKLRVDVSNANITSWEVDEFISPPAGSPPNTADTKVASITWPTDPTYGAYAIHLTGLSGYLCYSAGTPTVIPYGQSSGCSDPPGTIVFSTVSVMVNGQTQPTATLNCLDSSDPKGQCRIVFRGH